jgi:isoquinoline 1-oxidoreductase beta subunit
VMRLAGVQAKLVLMQAAGDRWGVPVSEVATEPHVVVHRATGRRLGYGEIASFAKLPEKVPVASKEMLKAAADFRLIGKDVPRIEVPLKVNGEARYGIDVRLPGMLYGAVLCTPVQGEKPERIDDAEAKKIPGVRQIVPMPYGVGVLADTYYAARKAKAALKVTWSTGAKAREFNNDKVRAEYLTRVRNLADTGVEYEKIGDPKAAFAGAAKTLTAEYATEPCAHACMEPMNCTARVDGEKIEVWVPAQSAFFVHGVLTRVNGFKPENITSHITLLGGGFGRRVDADYVVDAGFLAKAVPGRPVKVVWTREDDIQRDKFRPLTVQRLAAGLDAQGNLVALHHRLVSESIYARAAPPLFQKSGGRDTPVNEGAFELKYGIPNRVLEYLREQRGVDGGFWRGVGVGYTKFAIETFVDELAAAAGKDPVSYRLQLLANEPRGAAVVREAVAMANWSKPRAAGRALGVAYSDTWGSHIAEVAEVSVDRKSGRVRVHEVWAAVDCGVALQPKNVEAQIESAIMYGLSQLLGERITFKDGVVQESNFHNYPILRMNEAPKVTVKVIRTENFPGGIGEVGVPPLPPAVANAVAVLTGKRMRSLPFDQNMLKA